MLLSTSSGNRDAPPSLEDSLRAGWHVTRYPGIRPESRLLGLQHSLDSFWRWWVTPSLIKLILAPNKNIFDIFRHIGKMGKIFIPDQDAFVPVAALQHTRQRDPSLEKANRFGFSL
jgi:hypothetical protein